MSKVDCEHRYITGQGFQQNPSIGWQCDDHPDCKVVFRAVSTDVLGELASSLRSLLETGPRDGYGLGIEDAIAQVEAM